MGLVAVFVPCSLAVTAAVVPAPTGPSGQHRPVDEDSAVIDIAVDVGIKAGPGRPGPVQASPIPLVLGPKSGGAP